ncbi:VOC family protein [candidate division KSB1 bacterium]|nr:VOC family protein [candidate division KSB1 bacterium]
MNLNQVTLPAVNIVESVSFYRKMGFTQIVESPHYARFECPEGDSTFSVHLVKEINNNETGVVIYFESERLDELVDSLKGKGFQFLQEPTDESWLWREARLKDPAGNEICLYYAGENRKNPPWRINKM